MSAADDNQLAAGTLVGRYVLLHPIESGGARTVFAARDTVLKRQVALEVMHSESAAAHLTRLAQLTHPHVEAVYELGTWQGRPFVAMELVAGRTLSEWLLERPRPTSEVLRTVLEAGQGLCAAHAVGVVHGSFTPASVLIDEDGRVRVVGFGHAADTSEASDAYRFAVVLSEAMGRSRGRAPKVLSRILARALNPDPAARYAGLDGLLAELQRASEARWKRRGAAAAVALLAILLGGSGYFVFRRQLCRAAGSSMSGIWNEQRRATVHAAFQATGTGFAESAFQAAARALDAYAGTWTATAKEACLATRLRGEQTPDILARENGCLERRLKDVDALVILLAKADATTVENAPQAVDQLDDLAACTDVPALLATAQEADPARRAALEPLEAQLATARAFERAGQYEKGMPLAQAVAQGSQTLGATALEAEALFAVGRLFRLEEKFPDAEAALRRAALSAEAARQDAMLARIWLELAILTGDRLARPDGKQWVDLANAAIARQGHPPRLEGMLRHAKANLAAAAGKHEEAIAEYRAALPILERALGRHDAQVRNAVMSWGWSEYSAGHREQAIPLFDRALDLAREDLGPAHPLYAQMLLGRGTALLDAGKYSEARRDLSTAVDILQSAWPDTLSVAMALYDLGGVDLMESKFDDADARFTRALDIQMRKLGADHPETQATLKGVCESFLDKSQARRALPRCKSLRPSTGATALLDLGRCEQGLGHPAAALALLEKAAAGDPTDDPLFSGHLNFALAQARWAVRRDPTVPKLLASARQSLEGKGPDAADLIQQLEIWARGQGLAH